MAVAVAVAEGAAALSLLLPIDHQWNRTLKCWANEFRGRFLLSDYAGKVFIDLYYVYSPPAATFISKHSILRVIVRWSLLPSVGMSWIAIKLDPSVSLALTILTISSGLDY